MKLEIYTDGSATVKTKPGGYGWVLVKNGEKIDEGSGYIPFASNNDAELEAAIQGLMVVYKYIEKHFFYGCGANLHTPDSYHVTLVSDSQIILNWASGISQFKQQNKLDKYRALQLFVKRMNVQTRWVKGHTGDEYNERCDELANMARLQTIEKPKKSKKETKKFRWNDNYLGMSGASPIGVLKEIHKDNHFYTVDALIAIVLELVELEESRRK